MLFSKKWLKNHPKFLLHFLIHIDVLMLCSKFELIPTDNFRVTVFIIISTLEGSVKSILQLTVTRSGRRLSFKG